MMNIALRLPDSLGMSLKEFSKHENISMNQFITTAIAEKMSALQTYDYLQERSKEGSIAHARSVLNKVPNRYPMFKEDEL
ncbi:MAG: toxin-antitoxin system HicB family antitoxin [Sulfuricurvum sp.]|nr:toxin-antitoxin system HicB family antitoxin [Sulfuricurvum sp.]